MIHLSSHGQRLRKCGWKVHGCTSSICRRFKRYVFGCVKYSHNHVSFRFTQSPNLDQRCKRRHGRVLRVKLQIEHNVTLRWYKIAIVRSIDRVVLYVNGERLIINSPSFLQASWILSLNLLVQSSHPTFLCILARHQEARVISRESRMTYVPSNVSIVSSSTILRSGTWLWANLMYRRPACQHSEVSTHTHSGHIHKGTHTTQTLR
eukprot:Blabericola_migrator_1__8367@NODE_4354_length_1206_cov_3_376646_g2692_i0_p1_GENE_NODE_4354_length_1206_cov_3_376646_g2692_i0NODE_4354_length_1206_cov_3_376646_g2692_i0_p1_ORF_typecomplete_len206_score8_91Laminin_G_3/PF13385_6/0_24Laminin_G_3/PF13385_6/1_3e04_NODE_4354_length_1206_cov_3_376646_g2692_i03921009